MKETHMNSSKKMGLALVGIVLAGNLAARSVSAADDTWITTKARIALLTTDGAGRTDVKVDTDHGKVTLHGKVDGQAVKDKAEATVRGIDGVTGVRNLLEVVPEARHDAVKASDKEIKEAVESALKRDPTLEGIKVESVDNGAVILDGHTRTLDHKLLAIEAAYGCAGVRHVVAQIETSDK
jgi:hyperosmotically inducible periplasmic protein